MQDANVEKIINHDTKGIFSLPSHLFIKLVPQLAARLNLRKTTYTEALIHKILKKCCLDHPHHTLIHIIALANAGDDLNSQTSQSIKPRTEAAIVLLNELKANHPQLKTIIDQMKKMTKTMINFSKAKIADKGSVKFNNDNFPLKNLFSQLNKVHCPTVPLPIVIDCNYDDKIIKIRDWNLKVVIMTGLSKPKRLVANCSDGKKYIQLLKGNDDLRQDAVMEQVFDIVNTFLDQDAEAKKRKLNIRTYKVVPFSPIAGILEFCTNTSPLSTILVDLHKRYRPFGMSPATARETMADVKGKVDAEKLTTFKTVCNKMTPVFQIFFYNNFPSPGQWVERKMLYTNSVATNSIIGYILGIGDRHVNK